jgi:GT2 family glycosyltransferase
MRVAVLSLARDRLQYTQHCFERLHELAGCEYDHYVLDQGSSDGTSEWLFEWARQIRPRQRFLRMMDENIGISRGMNKLLDWVTRTEKYDVIVKVDNDCELTQPGTLHDVAQLALTGGCLLSPRILGLKQPPAATRELRIGEEAILDIPQIGGIFLAAPAWVYDEFRYSDANPLWGGDDVEICAWFRQQGGTCGYVKRLEAWHYETTAGQEAALPDYFTRKRAEMAA